MEGGAWGGRGSGVKAAFSQAAKPFGLILYDYLGFCPFGRTTPHAC